MKKRFVIQHIWFNNHDADVTVEGLIKEDLLSYESKLIFKMSRLNAVISAWQKQSQLDASEFLCRYELGFITEYEINFPNSVHYELDMEEILGQESDLVKRIVA